jgi:hypothetical protein
MCNIGLWSSECTNLLVIMPNSYHSSNFYFISQIYMHKIFDCNLELFKKYAEAFQVKSN